jgi:hypothetical protein
MVRLPRQNGWVEARGPQAQLDTFQVLISKLIPLNDKLCAVASVYPDSRIFDSHPESKEAARHVYRTALDAYMAFHDESVRAELLLPADLSIVISEYSQGATRIISTAMNLRPELNHSRPDLTLLYKQQEARFNQAFNIMRLSSGIDALTSSVVRDVHSGEVVRLLQRSMTYL